MPINKQHFGSMMLPALVSLFLHACLMVLVAAPLMTSKKSESFHTKIITKQDFIYVKQQLINRQTHLTPKQTGVKNDINAENTIGSENKNPKISLENTEQAKKDTPKSVLQQTKTDLNQNNILQNANNAKSTDEHLDDFSDSPSESTSAIIEQPIDMDKIRQSIVERIESIWQQHPNQPNQAILMTVEIDDLGQIVRIHFGAGHQQLKNSAEMAVRAAAPFYELAGVKNSFQMQLVTTQELDETK